MDARRTKEDGTGKNETITMKLEPERRTHMDRETAMEARRTSKITAGGRDGKKTQTGGHSRRQGTG
jgi:hypothetical protein